MNYCENCYAFIPGENGKEFGKCSRAAKDLDGNAYIAPELGKLDYWYCSTVRQSDGMCGPEAKWYCEREQHWREREEENMNANPRETDNGTL